MCTARKLVFGRDLADGAGFEDQIWNIEGARLLARGKRAIADIEGLFREVISDEGVDGDIVDLVEFFRDCLNEQYSGKARRQTEPATPRKPR